MRFQGFQGANLVGPHEPRVTRDIRRQDRCKSPLNPLVRHEALAVAHWASVSNHGREVVPTVVRRCFFNKARSAPSLPPDSKVFSRVFQSWRPMYLMSARSCRSRLARMSEAICRKRRRPRPGRRFHLRYQGYGGQAAHRAMRAVGCSSPNRAVTSDPCHPRSRCPGGGTTEQQQDDKPTEVAGGGPHVFITQLLSPLGGPPVLCDRATILAASAMLVGDWVVWKQS